MNNLLDGIRRFKMARLMARKSAGVQNEIDGLVKMYEAIVPEAQAIPDPFTEMFKKVVDELSRRYKKGTFDYIRKHHPDLYQKINEAEDKLNEVWKMGLQGKADIELFRKILEQWTCLLENAIEIYP